MKPVSQYFPMKRLAFVLPILFLSLSSCITYVYDKQAPALVANVDIDQSIKVARDEIKKKNDMAQGLAIWVLRDQVVTPAQASVIADLYLSQIDAMKSEFNIWHASWAIANLYRLGDDEVKAKLEIAYQKAKVQPLRMEGDFKDIADDHINGKKLTTGFIHFGGLAYAYGHLVVQGNDKYIQSYEEYLLQQEK